MTNRDIQNAPKLLNSTPVKVFPVRNWMMPAISWAMPPNISTTPKTTGSTARGTSFAFTMLSMNVVTREARQAQQC